VTQPEPAERSRSWFGTAVLPGAVVIIVIILAVPKAGWRSLKLAWSVRTSSPLAW
jgi:hypothetical protein